MTSESASECQFRFPVGSSSQEICLFKAVTDHFASHQQRRFGSREAGGLLFGRVSSAIVSVVHASGPRPTDRRGRRSYIADRGAEQAEIDEFFEAGFQFLGSWHTHPEPAPRPSAQDLKTLSDQFVKSRHGLNAFLMIIVGQEEFPRGLHVSLHDGVGAYSLTVKGDEGRN